MERAHIIALACTLAAACSFDSEGRSAAAPDGSAADAAARDDAAASGGDIELDAATGDASPACAHDPSPTGPDAPCPGICDRCQDGVCTIDCGQTNCPGTITCPEHYECVVLCDGVDACDEGTVVCPPDLACAVVCSGGNDACGDLDLSCGAGSCSIECADDTCSGATVECGAGACTASCTGSSPATLDCGASCACTGC